MRVDEHTIELAASPVFFRSAPAAAVTPCYLHGIPTSSEDWQPFLERTGGIAPDLIGFGRSAKGGNLEYTPRGLAEAVGHLLRHLELENVALVGHGWGAVIACELAAAAEGPAVEKLVLIDPLPLTHVFRWNRLARTLQTPLIGELTMGAVTRPLLARHLRRGAADPDAWPKPRLDATWDQFDQGTQRAILRLHRSTAADHLDHLGPLDVPAMLLYGERDPWLTADQVQAIAQRLDTATVTAIPGAGHWPWLEHPEVIDAVVDFVT